MDIRLDGRVALVTGASRGIGKAIAATYAAAGAKVMISSRKDDALRQAASEMDGEVAWFAANAGDEDAAAACVAATIERFGTLDILVNNAATNPYYGPMLGISPSQFDKTIQVNLRGPLFWIQAAWEQALKAKPGVILNISSGGSVHVSPGLGVYNIAKAGLNQMTKQLASELAPTRLVCIAPGVIETDFAKVLVENHGDDLRSRLPVARLGQPQDIANLALLLVSDQGNYITGETIMVDGGIGAMPVLS
ncbi:MAG: putative oxidoreductase [Acidimicrobiia bacterium]|nr:putative oxidoreductase [Acidimicrobiia bacterium]